MSNATPTSSTTLLDSLKQHFAKLSLAHDVILNVVSSQPKRTNGLFPNLEDPPKVWLEECLITATTEADDGAPTALSQTTSPKRKLLVAALEVYIYTIPSTASTLIYISKVDSTGYSPSPSLPRTPAYTRALLTGFLSFCLAQATAPTQRVFVHLFARSQNQYLFPNSIAGGAKRVAGGAKLCAWWKGLFEEVVLGVCKDGTAGAGPADGAVGEGMTAPPSSVNLTYILPSYEAAEARGLLGIPKHTLPSGLQWQYLPPYHPILPSALLPNPTKDGATPSIAQLIPTFSDDPKARFLAELLEEGQAGKAHRAGPKNGVDDDASRAELAAKRQRTGHAASMQEIKRVRHEVQDEARAQHAKILARVSYDEFWERIGFRQECASGDVTGFFGVSVCRSAAGVEGNGIASSETAALATAPQTKRYAVPSPVFARVVAALLNHDFGSRQLAMSATEQFLASTEKIINAEAGPDAWQTGCTARVTRNADAQVIAPDKVPVEAPPVQLLAVRKKPKPAPKPKEQAGG